MVVFPPPPPKVTVCISQVYYLFYAEGMCLFDDKKNYNSEFICKNIEIQK